MSTLKRIDFSSPTIPANGKVYKFMNELSIARFKELDKLEVEFFYGFDMQQMFDKLKAAFEDLNKAKPADASVKIHNLMKGIADKVDKRENVVLRICSLYLVTEDEDVTKWSEELAKQKINDWETEGYAMTDFFSLAATSLPGFLKSYESVTQDMSEEAATQSQKRQTKSRS
jgi:hypothetical protein